MTPPSKSQPGTKQEPSGRALQGEAVASVPKVLLAVSSSVKLETRGDVKRRRVLRDIVNQTEPKSCNQRQSARESPLSAGGAPKGKSVEEPMKDEKEPRACEPIREEVGEGGATKTAPADTGGSCGTRASWPPTIWHWVGKIRWTRKCGRPRDQIFGGNEVLVSGVGDGFLWSRSAPSVDELRKQR